MGSLVSTAMQTIPQRENLAFPASLDLGNPTARCEHCQLVQFLKETRKSCLRCKRELSAVPPPPPEPAPVVVDDGVPYGRRLCLRIKVIRELKAIPQVSLANAMGCARSYISKIENMYSIPTLGSLNRLADALGVPISQLTDETIPPELIAMRTWAQGGADADLIAGLLQCLDQLSFKHRLRFTTVVKKLKQKRAAA